MGKINGMRPTQIEEQLTAWAKVDATEQAHDKTVQDRNLHNLFFGSSARTGLLPPYATLERDYALREMWRNDYNTLYKGAIMGLSKRIISTPYEINSPDEYGDYWQQMLIHADLGTGWASFIQKLVMDYNRYDRGAFVEIIGNGEAHEPLIAQAIGIAILDPLRCWLSGEFEHPVWYYGRDGKLFKLHRTRVYRFVDMPESGDYDYQYGYCSLSRSVSPVWMEILLGRYTTQLLDDNPPSGFVLFRNISEKMYTDALEMRERERETDSGGVWGRIIRFYQLQGGDPINIEFVNYSQAPEKFDFAQYLDTIAKRLATGIGIDIQDLWELTGGTLGSGMQSEVMHRKARGKSLGTLYAEIERMINSILPEGVSFEFKFDDPAESEEKARAVQMWAGVVASLANDLTQEERRKLLADNVPSLRDVLTDEDGQLLPMNETPSIDDNNVIPDDGVVNTDNPILEDTDKALGNTIGAFAQRMTRIVNGFINKTYSRFLAKSALRATLSNEGAKAYLDGKREAGGDSILTRKDEIELASWRIEQDSYITGFLDEVKSQKVSDENLGYRISLWVNKSIKRAYNLGLSSASPNRFYMWVIGNTVDHCSTCLRANGQVHRMRAWKDAGVLPQDSRLECGGWQCDCRLMPVQSARLFGKGDLRSVKRTLKEHRHTHEHTHVSFITPPADTASALSVLDNLLEGLR